MTGKVLRDAIIIGGLALGMAYAAIHKEKIYDMMGIQITRTDTELAAADPMPTLKTDTTMPVTLQGMAVSIPKSKSDGQFWTQGRVNNGMVEFLVDTGASIVALTPEDARRAGIRLESLTYNFPIMTAGGQNIAAEVYLETLSVGSITLRDVRAIVVPEGLNTSLLGMTFLGQLQKVEATPHALILRL
ncbi:MAG: TIGR02281 family clan AA aspartic protease [Hellea sp.]|nr:TIGR02281 family clan AA aspartic protease [Hellea sp.]